LIPRDVEAAILRLHHVEKWPVGTIADQLGVHHEVVERVLRQDGLPPAKRIRPSALDPYLGFVIETWRKYPKLPSTRLFAMCRERGYTGARDHFRHMVRPYRPRPRREAFLRLRTLPGEQAQFDWAHFGQITIGHRGRRPLMGFVAVLSWSRALSVRFYLDQKVENVLRGHQAIFLAFGGVPRVALYDNPKTIVVQRVGDAIRFHRVLLDFAAHYRYEPRPVPPRRPNEKGRVERAIRYVRSGFFLARKWKDLDELNQQVAAWCEKEAMERPWPEDPGKTVLEAFAEEREKLLPLPDEPFPTDERQEVRVQKTPYVRFDSNDYSVPHTLVGETLVVLATLTTVRVLKGVEVVARHPRSFDKGQVVEDRRHVEDLLATKSAAREHRGMDRLSHAAPATRILLERLAERGKNLGSATARLLDLLDTYGAESLEAAVREVLEGQALHVHAVRQVLERERQAKGLGPALPLPLSDDPRVRDLRVRPHPLESYDTIHEDEEDDHDDDDAPVPVA
jgi:transposase